MFRISPPEHLARLQRLTLHQLPSSRSCSPGRNGYRFATCDRLNVSAELLGNESAEIVDGKTFFQRRRLLKRCQPTDGHAEAPGFGTRTQQRANQCARKCDSDLKILECGIGITAISFRGHGSSNAPKQAASAALVSWPRRASGEGASCPAPARRGCHQAGRGAQMIRYSDG